ncbi:MAG: O-antigen ligase family protein [Candidatus Omnitrophica bacterium]|nr:O-antigen ligase family protein [Candidatus Omnitrophota bacterium]
MKRVVVPEFTSLHVSPPSPIPVGVLFILLGLCGFLAGLLARETLDPYTPRLLLAIGAIGLGMGLFILGMVKTGLIVHLCLIGSILDQWEGLDFIGIPFLTLSKILILMAGCILIVRAWMRPSIGSELKYPTPVIAHIPFSLVCLVSALAFGYSLTNSVRWVIAPVTLPIFAFILTQFITSGRQAVRLTQAFAIYSFFPIAVASAEILSHRRIGGSIEILTYGAADIFRVAGNFDNPNDFVVLILFSIPILLLWALRTTSLTARIALIGGVLLQGMILLKTYSRSGYLSLGCVFVAMLFLGRGRSRRLALAVCLLGAIAAISLPDVRERILSLVGIRPSASGASQALASLNYRKMLLAVGWNEFLEHPFLGTGFGNIGFEAKKYSSLLYQSSIENTYLEILAEMGIVGLTFYLGFVCVFAKVLLSGLRESRGEPLVEPYYLALACGYCGLAVNGLFDTNLVDNLPWVLLPLLLHLRPDETVET